MKLPESVKKNMALALMSGAVLALMRKKPLRRFREIWVICQSKRLNLREDSQADRQVLKVSPIFAIENRCSINLLNLGK